MFSRRDKAASSAVCESLSNRSRIPRSPWFYDHEVEEMKAKGLEVIETGVVRAEILGSDRVMSYEYMYFDTRKVAGFPIELMRPPAVR
jgi:hypothetical protein